MTRRRFLRGAGWVIGLPYLESLAPRRAAAAAPRKRFVLWYQPDGDMEQRPYWFPTGGETTFQLGDASRPLEAVRQDIIMLHGVHNGNSAGDCHGDYMPNMMTGGTRKDSIDQVIAAGLKAPTPFPSLELGVGTDLKSSAGGRLSFRGGTALPPEANPNAMFAKIFADARAGSAATAAADPDATHKLQLMQQRRMSVLDGVLEELAAVSSAAGRDDRARLDAHASAVRDFEKTLSSLNAGTPDAPPDCGKPAVDTSALAGQAKWNGGIENASVPNLDKIAAVQQQLLVLALRCDMTRVASLMYNRSLSSQTFEFLPIVNKTTISHMFAHTWRSSKQLEADFVVVKRWRASMFRDLVLALKDAREGAGTLLDSTVVLWTCEMGLGSHAPTNVPFVIAGNAGGALKTGRFLDYEGESHNKLFIALANAVGVPLTSFGNATGPLPRLSG